MRRKFLLPVESDNDNMSYYPGVSHTSVIYVELEEYIWEIHKHVDDVLKLNNTILNAMGISKQHLMGFKGQQTINPGYIYAPYIPIYTTPVINNTRKGIYGIYDKYKSKIVNSKLFNKIKMGRQNEK